MSFNISYLIQAQDRYTQIANRVSKSTDKMRGKQLQLTRAFEKGSKTSKKFSNKLIGLTGTFEKGSKASKRFSSRLLGLKSLLTVGAITIGLKKIINTGGDFQEAMADLSAITGITGEQLDSLGKKARIMSKEAVVGGTEVVEAFKLVASAKSELIKTEGGLEEVTKQALLLKNASGIDLVNSVDALTTSLNQFQEPASEAARFVNILAAGSKVGASEVFQTAEAIKRSGTAAKISNLSFEELNSLIQVLSKNGLKAQIAGTGLKTVLLRLATSGKDKFNPAIVGLNRALENLKKANLGAEESTKMFGLEGFNVGKILIDNAALVKQYTREITDTNVAQEQASKRLNTFNTRMKLLGITIRDKLIALFFRLEPKITQMTNDFIKFIDSISPEDIDNISIAFGGLLEVVNGVLKSLILIKKFFGTAFIATLSGGLLGFAAGGPVGAVVGATAAAAGALAGAEFGERARGVDSGASPFISGKEFQTLGQKSLSEIRLEINAPEGVIKSVTSKSEGQTNLRIGQNGRMALSAAF